VEGSLVDSEIFQMVKVGTQSLVLEARNKYLVFAIVFSLPLTLFYLHLCLCFYFTCYSYLSSVILVDFHSINQGDN